MKKLLLIAGLLLSINSDAATTSQYLWHSVLSCDNGAAVIDKLSIVGRGGYGTMAQIVIHDMNIIRYFNQAGVAQSELLDQQWIAQSAIYPQIDETIKSFDIDNTKIKAQIYYDGAGLKIAIQSFSGGQANWYFRNCIVLYGNL